MPEAISAFLTRTWLDLLRNYLLSRHCWLFVYHGNYLDEWGATSRIISMIID